ncbi:type III pantothenate kinase [Thermosulfurimonas dismutans]|uniref:Type III pantothenate kinase n=1 Tax=Thermosulfurimonas dismutans TaxID=999894 RepID=A0A179D7I1_9BACT|nr:type III pantothenate kinase [Thermosulfurimonas dismutans]OAQ21558.1 Pantothenate kinase type III, CoaX-like protein [Thermosulfurimonas dismutans]
MYPFKKSEDLIWCVDIGNTTTACGIFRRDGLLLKTFRFRTRLEITPEELLILLRNFLEVFDIPLSQIKGIALASVVPPLNEIWEAVVRRWLVKEWLLVSAEVVPIPVKLQYPQEVGADRMVNAYAGWQKFRRSVIIVDYGTATTFDCVSEKGEYLGGAIAPGLESAAESLFTKTAKLPRVDLNSPPDSALGRDTLSAMKSGLLYGFAALTEGLIARLSEEMKTDPLVLATGGLAATLAPLCPKIERIEPHLTLEGLFYLYREQIEK